MARIVLGVGGGIAAYKSCELLRLLNESGHSVRVVPTESALRFVGAATWAALSGEAVTTQVWDDAEGVSHVRLGEDADLIVIAPATADLMARAAAGLADDLLTNVLLAARCPVVYAPAMHTQMWQHPATVDNVGTLRRRGALVLEPAEGRLTGSDTGTGRLPEPASIAAVVSRVLRRSAGVGADLVGRRILISAGGTREPLDPVRFLGNASSGRQGHALALTALARGAQVTLVSANIELPDVAGVTVVRVSTAAELAAQVVEAAAKADVVVMAAAVADFRPTSTAHTKIKKSDGPPPPIVLEPTPDVLADLLRERHVGQVVVGFAAETGDDRTGWLDLGRAKLAAKSVDLLVVNRVDDGRAFGTLDNEAVILGSDGSETPVELGPKEALADAVWDLVAERLEP